VAGTDLGRRRTCRSACARKASHVDFRTTTQNLSPAINELDAAMRSGRLGTTATRCSRGASATWSGRRTGAATCSRPSSATGRSTRPWRCSWRSGRAQASESDGAEDITAFLLNPVMG
jgi:hypothetical protein